MSGGSEGKGAFLGEKKAIRVKRRTYALRQSEALDQKRSGSDRHPRTRMTANRQGKKIYARLRGTWTSAGAERILGGDRFKFLKKKEQSPPDPKGQNRNSSFFLKMMGGSSLAGLVLFVGREAHKSLPAIGT